MKRLRIKTIEFIRNNRGKITVGGILGAIGLLLTFLDFFGISAVRTPTPTIAPKLFIELVDMTNSVVVDRNASLSIRTLPYHSCFLSYLTPAGHQSKASDLGFTTANSQGVCSWSWYIHEDTTPGQGELTVRVDDLEQKLLITIIAGATTPEARFIQGPSFAQTLESHPESTITPTARTETECIPKNGPKQTGIVVEVVDGDTIKVHLESGDTIQVRYIGVDTPERGEPYHSETSTKNQELVLGKTVWLFKDVSEADKYGRLLRYVVVDGLFVNYELVSQGYALPATYPPDVACAEAFSQAAIYARENGLGLWIPQQTTSP